MRVGYLRVGKLCPSEEDQIALLRRAGIEDFDLHGPVYRDEMPERKKPKEEKPRLRKREAALKALREGDELVIAYEGVLGVDVGDVMFALAEIAERGGVLVVASTGRSIAFHPTAAQGLDAAEAGRRQQKEWSMAYARRHATEHHRGGGKGLTGKKLKEAQEAWHNPKLSVPEVVAISGRSEPTLRRMFGGRGTPRFGGKGRKR